MLAVAAARNTGSTSTLDDTTNALLLRADLHVAFDKPRIAFMPKPAGDSGEMRLVAHMLEYSPELEHLYHNRELHPTVVDIDMLYARFACSVLSRLDAFLEFKTDRRLALRTSDACLADARGFINAANCEFFPATAMRKRSRSPRSASPSVRMCWSMTNLRAPSPEAAENANLLLKLRLPRSMALQLRAPDAIQSPTNSLLSPLDCWSSSHPPSPPLTQTGSTPNASTSGTARRRRATMWGGSSRPAGL